MQGGLPSVHVVNFPNNFELVYIILGLTLLVDEVPIVRIESIITVAVTLHFKPRISDFGHDLWIRTSIPSNQTSDLDIVHTRRDC